MCIYVIPVKSSWTLCVYCEWTPTLSADTFLEICVNFPCKPAEIKNKLVGIVGSVGFPFVSFFFSLWLSLVVYLWPSSLLWPSGTWGEYASASVDGSFCRRGGTPRGPPMAPRTPRWSACSSSTLTRWCTSASPKTTCTGIQRSRGRIRWVWAKFLFSIVPLGVLFGLRHGWDKTFFWYPKVKEVLGCS